MKSKVVHDVLLKISKGEMKRYEAAEALAISERQVNRLMRRYSVVRPKSELPERRQKTQERRATQAAVAQRVAANEISYQQGADVLGVSVRTVYRWVEKLSKTPQNSAKVSENTKK